MSDFADRPGVAVVTGGSGGLGAPIARLLAARGSSMAITYRKNATAARRLARELEAAGTLSAADQVDLTDDDAAARYVHAVAGRFGGIHTLVYASGPHVPMTHLSMVPPARFRQQIEEDAVAFFNLVQPALPLLRETRGSIVAVTTAATTRYPVRDGLSSGPKGAVEALVRGIAAEEGRYGVRANCVGPGMLTDGMSVRLIESGDLDDRALAVMRGNIPLGRFGTAEDVAEAVCFLASDRARYISGQKLDVDGGYGI